MEGFVRHRQDGRAIVAILAQGARCHQSWLAAGHPWTVRSPRRPRT
ncbi:MULTISPECIES: hypothetical protein [unclassified Chelatococcus]|nr:MULTISPECIES: hypothetical protein [unclassified Chelatococcus]